MSYNICEGGEGRLSRIAAVIRGQAPHAVALLEAASRAHAGELAELLGMELVFGEANNPIGHIAWLSALPVSRSANHRRPDLAKTLLEIEVVADGAPLTLFATHLGSRWDVPQPEDEIPVIVSLLRQAAGRPHALAGDFNALRPGDPVGEPPAGVQRRGDARDGASRRALRPLLDAGYLDCWRALHPEAPGYTYPTDHPWLRLDYIFASPGPAPALLACDVVQEAETAAASDHFPVVAEFRPAG
jgi:endonuclease/exonuclease/phosphatase family metal-dependent hydrolase